MNEPQFIQELKKKLDSAIQAEHSARLEVHRAQVKWEKAKKEVEKFPGWEVVDYRAPKQGETFLSTLGPAQPTLCYITDWEADEPIFILRKVEPAPEP